MKTDLFRKILAGLGFIFGFYILAVVLQPIFFVNRFGAYTHIAGVDVSFQTKEAAKARLEKALADYTSGKIVVGGNIVPASDLIKSVKSQETIEEALLNEQRGYFTFSKLQNQRHEVDIEYNGENINKLILPVYDIIATAPVDATIKVAAVTTVVPEQNGRRLLLVETRQNIEKGLSDMAGNIDYRIVEQAPNLTAAEAESVIGDAESQVSESVNLLGDGTKYEIKPSDLRSWLKITPSKPKTLVSIENFMPPESEYYYLDPNKVFLYVDKLAKGIDAPAVNAKLTVVSGKVVVAAKEQIGRTVDRKTAISGIQEAVTGDRQVSLDITTVKPDIRTDNLAEMGLVELIATGTSDFSGSPVNRIHNVKTGASKFNGVLMKPGEDISFNKILGPVDASTGYLPELVILADKTVPEYGGGLCQVSSTAFRAALNAGLPILERHAHAYPVSYYKPYGVDATIYLPTPDLRWKNDTGKYILVQTRIEGKKLYFDFYGTKKPVKITFSGNAEATGAVDTVEKITPTLTDMGVRGKNSFTAVFYRHIYDPAGKLLDNDKFTSKYDSPDKYPH